jgi:hypothetical protein
MCRLCDGASRDDLIAEDRLAIAVNGYTLCGVGDDDHYPWVYTCGLVDSAGHPELVIAGVSTDTSAKVLNALATGIVEGGRVEIGEHLDVAGELVRVGAVNEIQYELDTFAWWFELRDAAVLSAPGCAAAQVILENTFCSEHDMQPLLSNRGARVGALRMRPNRAARRRRRR